MVIGGVYEKILEDFPCGPVVRTPCFQCRGCGFDPWSGNKDPTCRAAWPKKKKKKSSYSNTKPELC